MGSKSSVDVRSALHQRRALMVNTSLKHTDRIVIGDQTLEVYGEIRFLLKRSGVQCMNVICRIIQVRFHPT